MVVFEPEPLFDLRLAESARLRIDAAKLMIIAISMIAVNAKTKNIGFEYTDDGSFTGTLWPWAKTGTPNNKKTDISRAASILLFFEFVFMAVKFSFNLV